MVGHRGGEGTEGKGRRSRALARGTAVRVSLDPPHPDLLPLSSLEPWRPGRTGQVPLPLGVVPAFPVSLFSFGSVLLLPEKAGGQTV